MEFRLTYQGPLLADTNRSAEVRRARATHKQEIRKALHPQLKRWWAMSPYLRPRGVFAAKRSRKCIRTYLSSEYNRRVVSQIRHVWIWLCSVGY